MAPETGMLLDFAGCTALVTGASRGIGRETALMLAKRGARVLLAARNSDDLQRVAREAGNDAIPLPTDLSNSDEVSALAESVLSAAGVPDILVNNAGAFFIAPSDEIPVSAFEDSLSVNMLAPFLLIRAFLPGMRERGSGHIVNVGSVADRVVLPGNVAYSPGKYGLRALGEVVRQETAGSGVRVSLVSPGPVDTRLWDPVDPDNREGFTPRAAMLTPRAVADAILYVLSCPAQSNIDELRLSRS